MGHELDEPLAGGCCLVVLIVTIVLFACSFDTLEPKLYGLVYDETFMTVPRDDIRREKREDGGRYMIGLGRNVIEYPRGLIAMDWNDKDTDGGSIEVWTNQGQNVYLDLSLQVRLSQAKLAKLYYTWGTHYRDHLRVLVVSEVKNLAPRYDTLSFFNQRLNITQTMENGIRSRFAEDGGFFELASFQLRSIALPSGFERAILEKILKRQAIKRAVQQRSVEKQEAEIAMAGAKAAADRNFVLEEARQSGDVKVAKDYADGVAAMVEEYAVQYKRYAVQMGWIGNSAVNTTSDEAANIISSPMCADYDDAANPGNPPALGTRVDVGGPDLANPLQRACGEVGKTASGATPDYAKFGFAATHYFMYGRLGRDHRTGDSREVVGNPGPARWVESGK